MRTPIVNVKSNDLGSKWDSKIGPLKVLSRVKFFVTYSYAGLESSMIDFLASGFTSLRNVIFLPMLQPHSRILLICPALFNILAQPSTPNFLSKLPKESLPTNSDKDDLSKLTVGQGFGEFNLIAFKGYIFDDVYHSDLFPEDKLNQEF